MTEVYARQCNSLMGDSSGVTRVDFNFKKIGAIDFKINFQPNSVSDLI